MWNGYTQIQYHLLTFFCKHTLKWIAYEFNLIYISKTQAQYKLKCIGLGLNLQIGPNITLCFDPMDLSFIFPRVKMGPEIASLTWYISEESMSEYLVVSSVGTNLSHTFVGPAKWYPSS